MKGILFCPKLKPFLNVVFVKDRFDSVGEWVVYTTNNMDECSNVVNGFAVAECDFDIEGIDYNFYDVDWFYSTNMLVSYELYRKSCMKEEEMEKYLKPKLLMFSQDNIGYALHIKNIRIFQNPRELSDFEYTCCRNNEPTLRAVLFEEPKNMMKVINCGTDALMISVKPEELNRLLKGEQSILIRKTVSKELL